MPNIERIKSKCSRRKKSRRSEAGMTLIEVTISLLIASVGLLSLAQLFGVAAALNTASRNNVQMARAAQEALENLRGQTYDSVVAGTVSSTYIAVFK